MHRDGRFEGSIDIDTAELISSLDEDSKIFKPVIYINKAHVKMLEIQDIIPKNDAEKILKSLKYLENKDFDELDLKPELEDIHMVIEDYVNEQAGIESGGKMHTAKSRNDQVSAAIRMVLREEILEIQKLTLELLKNLVEVAEENLDTVMPGYTHLQVAEPTTFAHYISNYIQALLRTIERLEVSYDHTNKNPLGAGAFAGTSFQIDRELTSELLAFDDVLENTMDATGSRDFVLDVMSNLSILMSTLSRFSEELVVWSSSEFDMLEFSEEFSSPSSIMPQKKNPVVPEMVRANAGKTVGNLTGGFEILKNLPQAYNLDIQELTPLLWDTVSQTKESVKVLAKLVKNMEINEEKMRENAEKGFASLTELANSLVRECDISFRVSHEIVGELALRMEREDKDLDDIEINDFNSICEEIIGEKIQFSEKDLEKALDVVNCVKEKDVLGGPSPGEVKNFLEDKEEEFKEFDKSVNRKIENIENSLRKVRKLPEG